MQHWHTPVSRRADTDADPAPLFGGAAGLLFAATLLARASGAPVVTLHRRNADGTVQQARVREHLRDVWVWQRSPQELKPEVPANKVEARLAWLPEGFFLTPRSAAAPQGWGLPPTADGKGTPGGPLREVLLNTKAGNQYPQALHAVIDPRPNQDRVVEAAPLLYMPWERAQLPRGIGALDGARQWHAQFDERGRPRWQEPDAGRWFCHRPRLARESAMAATARAMTNAIREAAGREPLGPPLLGWAGTQGGTALHAMSASGVYGHDSRLFPQGYETYVWRLNRRAGFLGQGGENIAYTPMIVGSDADRAAAFVQAWRQSPDHYANMIDDWLSGGRYAWVEFGYATDVELHTRQLPPYGLDAPTTPINPPALDAHVATQHFASTSRWLWGGAVGRPVDPVDRVGLLDAQMTSGGFFFPYEVGRGREIANGGRRSAVGVLHRGRGIVVSRPQGDENMALALGAVIRRVATGEPLLRVAVLERAPTTSWDERPEAAVALYEGQLHDFLETRRLVSRFALPERVGVMSAVRLSPMGQAVFCYSMPEPHLWRARRRTELFRIDTDIEERFEDDDPPDPQIPYGLNYRRFWGGRMHFQHWSDHRQDWESPLPPQGLDVQQSYSTPAPYVERVLEECAGEYALLGDFGGLGGESLVFLRVKVNVSAESVRHFNDVSQNTLLRRMKGELLFPDGSSFVYQDHTTRYGPGQPEGMTGFVTQIGHVDVLRGANTAYIRFDMRGSELAEMDAEIVVCGHTVARKTLVMQQQPEEVASAFGMSEWQAHRNTRTFSGGNLDSDTGVIPMLAPYHWGTLRGREAALYFAATLRHPPLRSWRARKAMPVLLSTDWSIPGAWGHDRFAYHRDAVAPTFMYEHLDGTAFIQVEFHKDAWLAGGRVDSLLRKQALWWPDDQCVFHASSLPLNSLVGASLSRDIFPMGVV